MDMKKILQAMDGANTKAEVNSSDIKKFLTIVEGKGPLNRATAAESLTMQHYTENKKTITAPVLNVQEGAVPSMIGKYFKAVEQELAEAADRSKDRARQLAERVIERVTPTADGSLPDPSINRLTGKPNPPAADPAPTNVKPSGATVDYGGATYNLVGVFGDGIRPRISRGDKVIPAKAYVLGDKMYVLLDTSAQEGVAEGKKTMSRAAKGNEKYGKDGMKALAKAGRDGASEKKLDAIRDKHDNYNEGAEQYRYTDILEMARQGLSDDEIAEQLGFDLNEGLKDPKDNPCWKGYKPVGTKKKGGRTVPNCVPKE